jgi:hypothetical protein
VFALCSAAPCASTVCPETLVGEWLAHHSHCRAPVEQQANQRPPDGNSAQEGAGAIDRVEDPLNGAAAGGAEFFAHDGVFRESRGDQVAYRPFRLAVGIGDGIEAESFLGLCADVQVALCAESRQGLPVGRVGERVKEGDVWQFGVHGST